MLFRLRNVARLPVPFRRRVAGLGKGDDRVAVGAGGAVFFTEAFVLGFVFLDEIFAPCFAEEIVAHTDDKRGILHVRRGTIIGGRNLDRRVGSASGGTADEQRDVHAAPLHFLGVKNHLIKRGRDEPAVTDEVDIIFLGCLEDGVAADHHAEVNHMVTVAGKHDAEDVFTNVVHVALHGGKHDRAGGGAGGFPCLHEGLEMRDRFFHHAGALHDLRQEHLSRAKEVADDFHPIHQRPFDDLERSVELQPRFLGVVHHEIHDAVHQRVAEPFGDGRFAP